LNQAHDRFLRAGLLEELGRPEEALDWYASFGWDGDVFYLGPGQLRSAEIYERLGEREKAALYYKRFIDRWRDCDPELRPILAGAEQALVRLTGEPVAP
jgi:tetratricopeptide (TPR) repeat protein